MAHPKPGQCREARRALRRFKNAMRGASAWAVAPIANVPALHETWEKLGLEVSA